MFIGFVMGNETMLENPIVSVGGNRTSNGIVLDYQEISFCKFCGEEICIHIDAYYDSLDMEEEYENMHNL